VTAKGNPIGVVKLRRHGLNRDGTVILSLFLTADASRQLAASIGSLHTCEVTEDGIFFRRVSPDAYVPPRPDPVRGAVR